MTFLLYTVFFVVAGVPDDKSWKAEAEIDMELFHQVNCAVVFISNYNTVSNHFCIAKQLL